MRRYLFIVLLLTSLVEYSKSDVVDSLSAVLRQDIHDTDRVIASNDLAWELKYSNPDSAIDLAAAALSLAQLNEWNQGVSYSCNNLGRFYWFKGDYPKSLECFFIALKAEKELDRKSGIARHCGNIGNIYNSQGDYPKAIEYYLKALKINEKEDYKDGIARITGNISIVYRLQDDYQKSLEYALKALKLNKELGRKGGIGTNLGNIGLIYTSLREFDNALKYYFQALEINEEIGDKNGIALNLGNIGMIYANQGDSVQNPDSFDGKSLKNEKYTKALDYFYQGLKIDEEMGNKNGIARHLSNIGSVSTLMGAFETAETCLERSLDLSKEIGGRKNLMFQYQYLSLLYDTTGRPAQAFEAFKLYIIYRDSMNNEEDTRAQTRTEMKYEFEKAELMKEQEEKETQRLGQEIRSRRDNLQYSVVLICLLVIGGMVALLGKLSLPVRVTEGLIFFAFLIFFEFLLVLADPYIETWSGGAPGIKLLFNAGIAGLIFPLHSLFEAKLKRRLVK